jgi:hypothetical protein
MSVSNGERTTGRSADTRLPYLPIISISKLDPTCQVLSASPTQYSTGENFAGNRRDPCEVTCSDLFALKMRLSQRGSRDVDGRRFAGVLCPWPELT